MNENLLLRERESEGGKCVGGVERAVVRRRPLPLNTCTAVVGQSIVLREGALLRGNRKGEREEVKELKNGTGGEILLKQCINPQIFLGLINQAQ